MVRCLDCGNDGEWNDRKKFMQHGYPKDFSVSISCMNCGSYNLSNSFTENILFYGSITICGGFILLLILAFILFPLLSIFI
jgi:hypothetical protein